MQQLTSCPQNTVMNPSHLFAQAIQGDSNYELEWLWYATKLTSIAEREYCLKRALYINPNNKGASIALKRLEQTYRTVAFRAPVFGFGQFIRAILP